MMMIMMMTMTMMMMMMDDGDDDEEEDQDDDKPNPVPVIDPVAFEAELKDVQTNSAEGSPIWLKVEIVKMFMRMLERKPAKRPSVAELLKSRAFRFVPEAIGGDAKVDPGAGAVPWLGDHKATAAALPFLSNSSSSKTAVDTTTTNPLTPPRIRRHHSAAT